MPILLYRVDERLIHGQVVVGWGGKLRPGRYLVVDGVLATSQWEQDLYTLGIPERTSVEFVPPDEAREALSGWRESELRSLLLTRDLDTMLELARGGALSGEVVNLGGIHMREGRVEVLPYLFLDEVDRVTLRDLAEEGVTVSAQDLPGSTRVSLESLLG